jgi:signal transduction histidine kinase
VTASGRTICDHAADACAGSGTGLGLSVSRELARVTDGDLTLESLTVSGHDPGDAFTVILPAEAPL